MKRRYIILLAIGWLGLGVFFYLWTEANDEIKAHKYAQKRMLERIMEDINSHLFLMTKLYESYEDDFTFRELKLFQKAILNDQRAVEHLSMELHFVSQNVFDLSLFLSERYNISIYKFLYETSKSRDLDEELAKQISSTLYIKLNELSEVFSREKDNEMTTEQLYNKWIVIMTETDHDLTLLTDIY
ncbi:hypothetical protein [Bacillus solimangrovi]|uniref:Uncharacterized protein n=1 Tax=Bacillus solimangrovi TaxID=1305675 RepID=A0A1E5LJJ9_9BACI|nr:hypothetical protein [Bacillus solimangrovi]OEH94198.1 hypothetical protein BFG57_09100 [Bacillus solimangrovi]